ncbi:MAG: hypothetical protein AB8U25_01790 [Rickettsiales endosymbiont of Dermacentor nuttalli]
MKQETLSKLPNNSTTQTRIPELSFFEKGIQRFSSLFKQDPNSRKKFYSQKTEFVKNIAEKQNTKPENQR